MTTQSPEIFGRDIYCDPITEDADDRMSEVTGVALVKQDLRHRLRTNSVLGPDGDDNGFDIGGLLGSTAAQAAKYHGRIKRVALKDQRIDSAAVVITDTTAHGLTVLTIDVQCTTALGPFRLAFRLDPAASTEPQVKIIEAQ